MRPLVTRLRPTLTRVAVRSYAVQAPGAPTLQVFDRRHKWMQKERAAANVEESRKVDYLKNEVANRLCERLLDINRRFENVLDLGANSCNIARALTQPPLPAPDDETPQPTKPLTERIGSITAAESSSQLLYRDADLPFNSKIPITREVLEDEETLPYEANSFDAVLSSFSLHWINDLPSVLRQINNVLKPDCPLIAAMLGGDSLYELRTSLQLAEQERRGGVAQHTSPLADVRDVGGLLGGAGYKLLTVDIDDIVVDYPDIFAIMQDLQAMGESNAVATREAGPIQRDVLLAADSIYRALHGNEDGTMPCTFRIIYLIGWKESPDQAKPLARGSGEINIKDILGGGQIN